MKDRRKDLPNWRDWENRKHLDDEARELVWSARSAEKWGGQE